MSEQFPRHFDPLLYQRLRKLYGATVPPMQDIRVRAGLHDLVDDLFARIGRLPESRKHVRILRIETRTAGWLKIDITGTYAAKTAAAEDIQGDIAASARQMCEHCGNPGRIVIKVGSEALLVRPDLDPVDRLLCLDCADTFQTSLARGAR